MEVDQEHQRAFALEVVQKLRGAGFQALWAGGCVRDLLLGKMPKDYDVATNARPEEVQRLFGRRHTLAVGAAFGVIMVRGPKTAGNVEVDSETSDGRRPDHVTFSDPQHDAARRDFTINGMFFDPVAEEVLDYVGGRDDLENKLIRAIGDPHQRIQEDKLRMLRAVRFSAKFDFALDPTTQAAIAEMAPQISVVSAERIQAELRNMLESPCRSQALGILQRTGLLSVLIPEAPQPQEINTAEVNNAWLSTLQVLDRLHQPSFPLSMAVLLRDAGSDSATSVVPSEQAKQAAQKCQAVCERLRMSNHETDVAVWLVEHQHDLRGCRTLRWSQLQPLLIHPFFPELMLLEAAVVAVHHGDPAEWEHCRRMLLLPPSELNPAPLLGGVDLIAHGLRPGPLFKELLDSVRTAQLDGEVHSREDALKWVDKMR